jgi:predicted secreted protein
MLEFWKCFKLGDKVRIVGWPQELREECLHEETRELYRWLIKTSAVLEVAKIDEWGLPYGEVYTCIEGIEKWHYLALNHGKVELLGSETKTNDKSP